MALNNSQIVPAAFWVGFVVLGLVTSSSGPEKRHGAHSTHAMKAAKASPMNSVIAETTGQDGRGATAPKMTEVAD